ncbi:MAG: 5-formyltetrahydrofolate cyclo-ligase [Gammaproteobacteria bacterium]
MTDRRSLRKSLRAARGGLSPLERRHAAERIAALVAKTLWLKPGIRVALYAALPEEIATSPLIALAARRRAEIFLPRIENDRARRMTFAPPGPHRRYNRYGIPEPDTTERIAPQALQIVFVPLVGFDARGNRLGMGAGFYDRALAFRRHRRHWFGPRLIGIAHSCQQIEALDPLPSDIPLDAVVTEREILVFRGENR